MENLTREQLKDLIRQPLIPLADNFTPRERTPWGGHKIAGQFKKWLNLPQDTVIGESWEISGHRSFPNKFRFQRNAIEVTMPELLKIFPNEILGKYAAQKFKGQIPILVKLLDTAENLSVQIHPNDSYQNLKSGEMGKSEAWYILDAEPESGLYLGLREGVTREHLWQAVTSGEDLSQFLNFVPVQPGEIYFIPTGTIHAIGKGITLIEPQQTSETTYRFWDWNRLYDEKGVASASGKSRPLHLEDSFAVTNFNAARGEAFISQIKGKPRVIFEDDGNEDILLLRTPYFMIEKIILTSKQPLYLMKDELFQAFTVINGEVTVTCRGQNYNLTAVQSFLMPAEILSFQLKLKGDKSAELIKVYCPISEKY